MTQSTDPISITLEAQQWNTVLAGLGELPWRVANPVMQKLFPQLEAVATVVDPTKPIARTNGDAREIEEHVAA